MFSHFYDVVISFLHCIQYNCTVNEKLS